MPKVLSQTFLIRREARSDGGVGGEACEGGDGGESVGGVRVVEWWRGCWEARTGLLPGAGLAGMKC